MLRKHPRDSWSLPSQAVNLWVVLENIDYPLGVSPGFFCFCENEPRLTPYG